MNAVWIVPALVVLVGGAAIVALVRGTTDSARELGAEIARFGELHVAMARVRDQIHEAGQTLQHLRER
jgi:hypothetical protein